MLQLIIRIGPRWKVSPNGVHERVLYVAFLPNQSVHISTDSRKAKKILTWNVARHHWSRYSRNRNVFARAGKYFGKDYHRGRIR